MYFHSDMLVFFSMWYILNQKGFTMNFTPCWMSNMVQINREVTDMELMHKELLEDKTVKQKE